ncbi:hypothetical protein DFH28DRAFT_971740 [Melampsora americana]|nr:hypothetical protein DFH28DRAFT_971740 [Melampsora americana]
MFASKDMKTSKKPSKSKRKSIDTEVPQSLQVLDLTPKEHNMGGSLGEQHFTGDTIPTSDEQATPDDEAFVKEIENALMEDTDPNEHEQRIAYPGSDSTNLWSDNLQNLENLGTSKHTVDITKPPKRKKRKSVMIAPQNCQGLETLLRTEEVKEGTLAHSKLTSQEVLKFLKIKGALTLWHNPKVSKQIDKFFNQIDKNACLNLFFPQNTPLSKDQVNSAIEKVRTHIVMAYLGGLRIIFQGNANEISTESLVSDQWKYLQNYLHQEFNISQKELSELDPIPARAHPIHFSRPFSLLQYVLKLKNNTYIHSSLVFNLMSSWATQTIHQNTQYPLRSSADFFISIIEAEAKLQVKKIRYSKRTDIEKMASSPVLDRSGSMREKIPNKEIDPLKKIISRQPVNYLTKIGEYFKKSHNKVFEVAEGYFKTLEVQMNNGLCKDMNPSGGQDLTTINSDMIQKVISIFKMSIMPAFIASLILFHQDQETEQVIESLIRTGWDVLQAYCSPWGKLFLEDKSSILLDAKHKAADDVKWYDAKDTIHYFLRHKDKNNAPVDLVWFLHELWYDKMIQKRDVWGENLDFAPRTPHRDVPNQIISLMERKGLDFQ